MKCRQYTSADYLLLHAWWVEHGFPPVAQHCLPNEGIVVTNEGSSLCAGFLIKTDTSIAWMEWLVKDPSAPKELTHEGLNILINALSQRAREQGFKTVFTSSDNTKLIDRLKSQGFLVGDENTTQLMRRV